MDYNYLPALDVHQPEAFVKYLLFQSFLTAAHLNIEGLGLFSYNFRTLTAFGRPPLIPNRMPEYKEIYNDVVANDARYNLAENSPGLRAAIQATSQLQMLTGRSLDVGCGVGFVVEYLSGPAFNFNAFGIDISDAAIDKAVQRLTNIPGSIQRLMVVNNQSLPFEDNYFQLVTCFDVLEHLDVVDIEATLKEIQRVLHPTGVFFGSVSCRLSGVNDKFGDNLHRTVKSADWWLEKIGPDRAEYDGHRKQLALWKQNRNPSTPKSVMPAQAANLATASQRPPTKTTPTLATPDGKSINHPHDTSNLYQKIYDENPWYGDAEQGRCPGVRLLPHYEEWLLEPVLDLGCGRGQTVEHLQASGMQAEGIDQIQNNPAMRVGDITKPIADISQFQSVVCVDCIEHLVDEQVIGLFENMKSVKRQAFSIHNGESTGTGQELHVNRKSFQDWAVLIRKHFDIAAAIEISHEQMLYLTQSKA